MSEAESHREYCTMLSESCHSTYLVHFGLAESAQSYQEQGGNEMTSDWLARFEEVVKYLLASSDN